MAAVSHLLRKPITENGAHFYSAATSSKELNNKIIGEVVIKHTKGNQQEVTVMVCVGEGDGVCGRVYFLRLPRVLLFNGDISVYSPYPPNALLS
jgi:hypothetical protein